MFALSVQAVLCVPDGHTVQACGDTVLGVRVSVRCCIRVCLCLRSDSHRWRWKVLDCWRAEMPLTERLTTNPCVPQRYFCYDLTNITLHIMPYILHTPNQRRLVFLRFHLHLNISITDAGLIVLSLSVSFNKPHSPWCWLLYISLVSSWIEQQFLHQYHSLLSQLYNPSKSNINTKLITDMV